MKEEFEEFRTSAQGLVKTIVEAGMELVSLAKNRVEDSVSTFGGKAKAFGAKAKEAADNPDEAVAELKEEAATAQERLQNKIQKVASEIRTRINTHSRK